MLGIISIPIPYVGYCVTMEILVDFLHDTIVYHM